MILNSLLLPINKNSHKGNFGHVAVLEGHPKYQGASRLVAYSSLRAHAGLVSILQENLSHFHPQDLMEYIKVDLDSFNPQKISSIAIGSGLSTEEKYKNIAYKIFEKSINNTENIIIDAEGLFLLKNFPKIKINSNIIATPHPKEASILLNCSLKDVLEDKINTIKNLIDLPINNFANITWVLKGEDTFVFSKNSDISCLKGKLPILSVAGSGDVLAGAILGLLKRCDSPLKTCLLAVSLQIASAKKLSKKAKRGILAHEIADEFPFLLK